MRYRNLKAPQLVERVSQHASRFAEAHVCVKCHKAAILLTVILLLASELCHEAYSKGIGGWLEYCIGSGSSVICLSRAGTSGIVAFDSAMVRLLIL